MSTNHVISGLWIDYSQAGLNQRQILVTDYQSGIITNALAVLITLTASPIYKLFKRPLYLLWKKIASWDSTPPVAPQDEPANAELIRMAMKSIAGDRWQHISLGKPSAPNGPGGPLGYLGVAFMLVLLIGPSIALIVTSVVAAGLATTKVALSSATDCGDYEFEFNPRTYADAFLEYEREAEGQAAEYAQKCYGPTSIATDCNKFYKQNITYKANKSLCPFYGDVCQRGRNGAYTLTTGLVSSTVLGINAANPYFFERTSTCAPIIADERYVKVDISDRGEEQWEYWYGSSLANYTWANPVKESNWEIKGYSMGVHCYDPSDSEHNFTPLPSFRSGPYPVNLMFISSHSIFYPHHREDPVFPARDKATFGPDYKGPTHYINKSTRAGVLGCVDQYQICKSLTGPCWNNGNISLISNAPSDRSATEEESLVYLLKRALDFSTSCGSVQFRQAEALDAQSKIAHSQSLPLPLEQWKFEAEKMFKTSLARMQLNVYDIVRGTPASYGGYHDVMPTNYREICKMVEIPVLGRTNINFWGLLGTVLAVALVWALSMRWKSASGEKTLMAVILWRNVLGPVIKSMRDVGKGMWTELEPLREFLWELFDRIR